MGTVVVSYDLERAASGSYFGVFLVKRGAIYRLRPSRSGSYLTTTVPILGDILVYVHLLIKESPTSTKLISMDFDSVRKHGLHVSSTFNTRLAYSCVLLFKTFPRSQENFETTLPH